MHHDDIEDMPPLARVAPERWAEARRRAKVLKDYLELPAPTMDETATYAAMLGLGRTQFRTLARSFSKRKKDDRAVTRHHMSIDETSEAEIDAALDRLGTDIRQDDLHAVVKAACLRKGLQVPSIATIRRRLLEVRACERSAGNRSGEIVLDHVDLDVLCLRDDFLLRPKLVAVLDAGNAEILAHDVDVGALPELQAARALPAGPIVIDPAQALRMAQNLERWCPPMHRLLADRMGSRIGRIPVARPGVRRRTGEGQCTQVVLDDQRQAIAQAIHRVDPLRRLQDG